MASEKLGDTSIMSLQIQFHSCSFCDFTSPKITAFVEHMAKMLKSMERMCKPGGYIGILDQTTLNWKPKNLKKIAMIAVTSVPNLDVRLFTVYRKDE